MNKIDYNYGKLLPFVITSAKNETVKEGFETKTISFVFEMFLNELFVHYYCTLIFSDYISITVPGF